MPRKYEYMCEGCSHHFEDRSKCQNCFRGSAYEAAKTHGRIYYGKNSPADAVERAYYKKFIQQYMAGTFLPEIINVIFSGSATIVFWEDNTKTVVKAANEPFDPEKGLAMAIAKKALGNKGNYFNQIKKWCATYFAEDRKVDSDVRTL